MSEFSDFCTEGMGEAFVVFGPTNVTISAIRPEPFKAIFDQFGSARSLELGGFVGEYDAQAVIQLSALSGVTAPIERTLDGKMVAVGGRQFRIDRVQLDEAGVTLMLNNPNKITR